ncbi:MAG TPA: hypothetical protein PLQ41_07115, partial [bacterium]|nr:hypothetical protein [bacterium]
KIQLQDDCYREEKIKKGEKTMCKCRCCCGSNREKEEARVYECKKCGKTSKEQKYCCGEMMKEKK